MGQGRDDLMELGRELRKLASVEEHLLGQLGLRKGASRNEGFNREEGESYHAAKGNKLVDDLITQTSPRHHETMAPGDYHADKGNKLVGDLIAQTSPPLDPIDPDDYHADLNDNQVAGLINETSAPGDSPMSFKKLKLPPGVHGPIPTTSDRDPNFEGPPRPRDSDAESWGHAIARHLSDAYEGAKAHPYISGGAALGAGGLGIWGLAHALHARRHEEERKRRHHAR